MRVERVFRLLGLLLGLIAGFEYALFIIREAGIHDYSLKAVLVMLTMLAGALFGFFGLPYVTTKPFFWLEDKLNVTPLPDLAAATAGLLVGLLLAALVGLFLQKLPWYLGFVVSLIVAVIFSYWGVTIGLNRRSELVALVTGRVRTSGGGRHKPSTILLDTSVIIDGRITDIAQTGFIDERLLVPHFVLAELQYIADSSDAMRRNRGRRGLEVLNILQKEPLVEIEFIDDDIPEVPEVDTKLIRLAKKRQASIMTNDYNLNRVAQLEGVRILNLNNLANALKPVVIPGEDMQVTIMKDGKEPNQGVGYLDDGTMIVVENGRRFINQTIGVVVTSVLQTAAGRMIFAAPAGDSSIERRPPRPLRRLQGGGGDR